MNRSSQSSSLLSLSLLLIAGCDRSAPAPVPTESKASAPVEAKANGPTGALGTPGVPTSKVEVTAAAAAPEEPFKAVGLKRTFNASEGCFSNVGSRWNVMVGRNPKKPCDFDTEDGFALSFDMSARSSGKSPIPKPGQTFEDRLYVEADGAKQPVYVESKIEVLRHEKPHIVVRITPKADKLPAGLSSFGGILKVRVRQDDEPFFDAKTWAPTNGAPSLGANAAPNAAAPGSGKKPSLTKKNKGVELSIWDTSDVNERIESCGDGAIVVILPLYPGADDWKVKSDKGLGTPAQEVRAGWRGPSSDSVAFRWDALKATPGNYDATFTSGATKVTVPIKVDPAHIPCD